MNCFHGRPHPVHSNGCCAPPVFAAPPPPGGVADASAPPPPPPPIGVAASMQWYTRTTILPRTAAICLAGMTDNDIYKLCTTFAVELSKSTKMGTVSSFVPLCEDVCYHSCDGTGNQDRDGFDDCKDPACADTDCGTFLKNVCPLETHDLIERLHRQTCSLGAPNPPPASSPPPRPPPPPRAPPPLAAGLGQLRLKSAETPTSDDCRIVTYDACRRASAEVGAKFALSQNIEISLAPCEQENTLTPCFIGCSLGAAVRMLPHPFS